MLIDVNKLSNNLYVFFLFKSDNPLLKEQKIHKNDLMKLMVNLELSEVELSNHLKKYNHIDCLERDIKKLYKNLLNKK